MSDLSDLAADVSKDLPAQVRKVIDTATAAGWRLSKPGMTLCLRLNHPADELAQSVYISWTVGRTPKGALSFRFDSCCTRGLVPLSGADLLEYLQDPTVVYMTDEDVEEADVKAALKATEDMPPWDTRKDQMPNLNAQLGATVLRIERPTAEDRQASAIGRPAARPLRVQVPKA